MRVVQFFGRWQRAGQWAQLAPVLVVAVPLGVLLFGVVLGRYGMSPASAWAFAAAIGIAFAAGVVQAARAVISGVFPSRWKRLAAAGSWGTMLALTTAALASAVLNLPALASAALAGAVFAVSAVGYLRTVDRAIRPMTRRPVSVYRLRDADALVEASRRQLRDTSMTATQRTSVEVNLAAGLAQRSVLAGNREGTDEAAEILARVLHKPDIDPWLLVFAVHELVTSRDMHASRHGDGDGYAEAIRLERDVVQRLPPSHPETATVTAQAYCGQATFHSYRMSLLAAQGAPPQFFRERELTVAALREGLRLARPRSELAVNMTIMLGSTIAVTPESAGLGEGTDLDEGIRLLRQAVRDAGRWTRDSARLHLALLLTQRAQDGSATAAADIVEAVRLATRVARGRSDLRGQANRLLAQATAWQAREGWT